MNPTLFFSLSVDFIPDMQDGRQSFIEKMKETATLYQSPFSFDAKDRPTIEKITSANLLKILPTLDLSAFGTWPSCILTCTIQSNHTVYSIGMSDGWDIYIGNKNFFAFAQFPADALQIMEEACLYYINNTENQSFQEFVAQIGFDSFRDTILGNINPSTNAQSMHIDNPAFNLKEGDFVRPEHNIMQIIDVYPDMAPFLMEYGMSCVGCFISYEENLWQGAQSHGLDVFEILGEMNEYIADKYNKKVISKETPMEDIITLYPQLLGILQSFHLEMPADMQTPLGAICNKATVNVNDVINACDDKLRGVSEI